MIDLGEFLVQFCSQVLGLFLLEEFRTFPDGSGGSGLPMDSVGFHTTPVGGRHYRPDFFLIIEPRSSLVSQQGRRRHPSQALGMTKASNNPC